MNPNDINLLLLEKVAARPGEDWLAEFVFVGGAVADLLISDSAMPAIRPTEDVDLLVQALTMADYYSVGERLMTRGFGHDMRPDAPIQRIGQPCFGAPGSVAAHRRRPRACRLAVPLTPFAYLTPYRPGLHSPPPRARGRL